MEAPGFDVDALDSALYDLETSGYRTAGTNEMLDYVNEQEKNILDYFVEDDLDFVDSDWDRLEVDPAELTTPGSLPGSADWERLDVEIATLASL